MKTKIISCNIFYPYLEKLNFFNDERFDITFLEIDQHNEPKKLYEQIQNEVNKVKEAKYIVLLYGICGNAINNVRAADIPIVIPKAHDCCTILLGSRRRFKELFSYRPSQGWSCTSYTSKEINRMQNVLLDDEYRELVEKYGEDNAKYVYETMRSHSSGKNVYITFNLKEDDKFLSEQGNDFEIIQGDETLLEKIYNLSFDDDFIILENEEKLKPLYDYDEVITKE